MSMIGKTLGTFTLEAQIGKGGMGEVYKAKDQKLGRDVAIKVLPEEFAKDADRVARFQREAKLLASLNHPNIAAIHGLEESDGTHFLVLELIEGDTLADRLKRGAIPVEESLKLALQIAEALEAAHEKGVIHRDLKPANIKVTPDGKVKVLDFGLAKAFAGGQAEVNLSHSPTLSEAATLQGIILGTAAYMSPEQARAKPLDKRTDIWAFGCVLYEMLTGKPAFQGEDVTEILAAVVKSEVNLDLLPANIHLRVREVITRCLQKNLSDRYRDIGDAQFEIKKVLADPSGVFVQPVTAAEPPRKIHLGFSWLAVTLVLGLIIGGGVIWHVKRTEPLTVTRFSYEFPQDQMFVNPTQTALAVSPDGKQLVYCTHEGLYLRSMDELTANLIPGSEEDPEQPFFSPDGKWIGYFSPMNNQLKKIAVTGGVSTVLCNVDRPLGARWYEDDGIIYSQLSSENIMRVSSNGGAPQEVIKTGSRMSSSPQILPGGKSILYTADPLGAQPSIMVQSFKSGECKKLFPGIDARYISTGHLVYLLKNNIYAVPFDPDKLEVTGDQVPFVENVSRIITAQWDISDSGTLVYMPGSMTGPALSNSLVWVDRAGIEEPIAAPPNPYWFPRISPDGTRVALTVGFPGNDDIWIWNLAHKNLTRTTFETTSNTALWTPDGKRIVYTSGADGEIYSKAADGTGKAESLYSIPDMECWPWSWSDKGKILVLVYSSGSADENIGMIMMEGDQQLTPLLQEKYDERQPQISPSGRWIAYVSNESGQDEIYVRPFPAVDEGRWQISTRGGDNPLWSADGRELFYRNGDAVMAVSVNTDPNFSHETPETLFQGTYLYLDGVVGTLWDISPDGKRFLMQKQSLGESVTEGVSRPKINIVLNWFEELKERVPVD